MSFCPSPAHPSGTGIRTPPELSGFVDAAAMNNAVFLDYYHRLRLLALSQFEWHNLPNTMNARYLEQTLYMYGLACFCPDPDRGFLSVCCMPSNYLNIYEEATTYTAWALGYQRDFPRDEIALVYNNYDMIPTMRTIALFAQKLWDVDRSIQVNIRAQKTPVILVAPESQRLTAKNLYKSYDGNEPVIFADKNLDVSMLSVLKTDAPYVADKLQDYKRNVWSEALSFLGVRNVDTEKRERLVTAEAEANSEMVNLSAEVMLLTRQQAAKEFNDKYGTNISVSMRAPVESDIMEENGSEASPEDE